MKRKITMLKMSLLIAVVAALFAPLLQAEEETTTVVRSASSATSATIAFDTRVKTVVETEKLADFGTKPLGMAIIIR